MAFYAFRQAVKGYEVDANVIDFSPRPHPMNPFFRRPQVSLVPTRKVIPPLILISVWAIKDCELSTRMSTIG